MVRKVVVEAPAKINLHLEVRDRRADGFHDILSLFQAVSLVDTLELNIEEGSEAVRLAGSFDCQEAENTIVRAARAFKDASGARGGLSIRAEKRIPAGAGLGGGSSDAAAVLKALNEAYGRPLAASRLGALGAALGSDVPFFLGGACAVVSGRGEFIEPAEAREDYRLVILFPGFPERTVEAYAVLDAARDTGTVTSIYAGVTAY
ncbi:MAG TPA: 4-(cytidine 5'-diphospho)-2-C-methyl-D-erythritol kinase, partial [Magnetospirillaceae bacterium]|nr:4-(cytidine 5'-diphospho)-2-C-methyl-D-erythritol kinase [Magnetospirillaceae bacterium]